MQLRSWRAGVSILGNKLICRGIRWEELNSPLGATGFQHLSGQALAFIRFTTTVMIRLPEQSHGGEVGQMHDLRSEASDLDVSSSVLTLSMCLLSARSLTLQVAPTTTPPQKQHPWTHMNARIITVAAHTTCLQASATANQTAKHRVSSSSTK
jgi:hypothetical protein